MPNTDPERPPIHAPRPGVRELRAPVLWGVVVGGIQAASPFGFWWLEPATVYALELALIAAIYIGFSVADGRWKVIAVECGVAAAFRDPRRRGRDRLSMAPGRWTGRARPQRPVAASLPVCGQHSMVAPVLRVG